MLPVSEEGTAGAKPHRLTSDEAVIRGLAWTADGRDIVFSSNRAGSQSLWRIVASGGEPEPLGVSGDNVIHPSVSPQGGRLVYVRDVWSRNIWRTSGPLATGPTGGRGLPTRLISSTREDNAPQFSPDGMRIVFSSTRSGRSEIWVCDSDGLNAVQLTLIGSPECGDPRWSPDGRHIAFDCVTDGNKDIWTISAAGGQPRRITTHASYEARPSWSHDGGWIYFGSYRSGDWQIWKKPFEGGEAVQVTRHGGREAFESWDGRFLYYAKTFGVSGVWRVPVEGGEEIQVLDHGRQGYWALIDKGICILNLDTPPQAEIEFYHFATQRLEKVATLPEGEGPYMAGVANPADAGPRSGDGYIAVSPDGQWLLYTQPDHVSSDLMLVENFR